MSGVDVKRQVVEALTDLRDCSECVEQGDEALDALSTCVVLTVAEQSKVSRARGLALALAEASDPEIPEQHEAGRRIAAEIADLLAVALTPQEKPPSDSPTRAGVRLDAEPGGAYAPVRKWPAS